MAFNDMNNRCKSCRHRGVHMCLTSRECLDNSEYTEGTIGKHGNTKKDYVIKNINNAIMCFRGEYLFLSNFYQGEVFDYKGYKFDNGEAPFQAEKCFSRVKEFEMETPGRCKKLGRKVQLRDDWEEVKSDVMYDVCKEKFTQDQNLKYKLLDTGGVEIIEGNSHRDKIWGMTFSKKTNTWSGRNLLGIALMKLRSDLRKDEMINSNWKTLREVYVELKRKLPVMETETDYMRAIALEYCKICRLEERINKYLMALIVLENIINEDLFTSDNYMDFIEFAKNGDSTLKYSEVMQELNELMDYIINYCETNIKGTTLGVYLNKGICTPMIEAGEYDFYSKKVK